MLTFDYSSINWLSSTYSFKCSSTYSSMFSSTYSSTFSSYYSVPCSCTTCLIKYLLTDLAVAVLYRECSRGMYVVNDFLASDQGQ